MTRAVHRWKRVKRIGDVRAHDECSCGAVRFWLRTNPDAAGRQRYWTRFVYWRSVSDFVRDGQSTQSSLRHDRASAIPCTASVR